MIYLSILICTTDDRKPLFDVLYTKLLRQVLLLGYEEHSMVEILYECDNKEISVGAKRQKLLNRSLGKYVVFIDSDDMVADNYIFNLLFQLSRDENIDCIGFLIDCDMQGVKYNAIASNKYDDWCENIDGFKYVRTIYHKTPVRKSIASEIGYKDMRFGEDYDFSKRLKQSGLLKKEVFIDQVMYFYNYKYENPNKKYGIIG